MDQNHLSINPLAIHAPGLVRDHSNRLYTGSLHMPMSGVFWFCCCYHVMLPQNPGPVNFRLVNSHSIRNKEPVIGETIISNNLDIRSLTETHIQISDTDSLLKSVTAPGFRLRPRMTGRGGGVGFLTDMHHWFLVKSGKNQLADCHIHVPGPYQLSTSLNVYMA